MLDRGEIQSELTLLNDFLQNLRDQTKVREANNIIFNYQIIVNNASSAIGTLWNFLDAKDKQIREKDKQISELKAQIKKLKQGDYSKELNERLESFKATLIDAIEGITEAEKEDEE